MSYSYSRLGHFKHVLSELFEEKGIELGNAEYRKIIYQFSLFRDKFDELETQNYFGESRSFLNYRFLAWKLSEECGIHFDLLFCHKSKLDIYEYMYTEIKRRINFSRL